MKIPGGGKEKPTEPFSKGQVLSSRTGLCHGSLQIRQTAGVRLGKCVGNDGWDTNSAAEVEKIKWTLWLLRNMH